MSSLELGDVIRFGGCTLHFSRREIHKDGELCEIEPRTFDLLVYLINHRDQVVSKEELLNNVWGTIHVTESVIPRAIMKLRRIVDANDMTVSVLKTVHRVGYRFVGQIDTSDESRRARAGGLPRPPNLLVATTKLAFLPFRNLTGDESFDWVEWGLVTIAQRAVTAAPPPDVASGIVASLLNVVPIEHVISALGGVLVRLALDEQIARLEETLNVSHCVISSISRAGDNFCLEWELRGPEVQTSRGRELGLHPSELVLRLSESIIAVIHRVPEHRPRGFDSDEVFLNEAYARAMNAFQRAEYRKSLQLMNICITAEDHLLQMDIDYVAILSRLGDSRCVPAGQAALERSRHTGHLVHQIALLRWLRNYLSREQSWELAETYAQDLKQLLSLVSDPETAVLIQMSLLDHAYLRGRLETASRLCEEILAVDHLVGDKNGPAFAHIVRGCIARMAGDHSAAVADLTLAMEISQRHQIPYRLEVAQVELGMTQVAAGSMLEASKLLEVAAIGTARIGDSRLRALALHGLCISSVRRGDRLSARHYLAQMHPEGLVPSSLAARYRRLSEVIVALMEDDFPRVRDDITLAFDLLSADETEFCRQLRILIAAPLRLRDSNATLKILASADALVLFHSSGLMEANLLHAFAQHEHAQNNVATSREMLARAVALLPAPSASWLVTMDAIWAGLEADDGFDPGVLIREIEPILQSTWMGKATLARYYHWLGSFTQAVETQRACLDMNTGRSERNSFLLDLMTHYQASARKKQTTLPPIAFLPSVY